MSYEDQLLEDAVSEKHPLRKIAKMITVKSMVYRIKELATAIGRKGYGLEVALACLILQFYYDLTDREMEERLRHDMAFRWFCGFGITEKTPDHSFFCRARKLIGTKRIGQIFQYMNKKSKEAGIMREVFTFVDASAIKAKETTWVERDKALKAGEEKLNNDNVQNYGADKDARFGCKGKSKFWYGHKKHASVDMGSGLIMKIAVTPANVMDEYGLQHICPDRGMVFGDKSYCLHPAQQVMKNKGCHSGAIMKNNMNGKNKDLDRWLSGVRAPYEGTFSKQDRKARYRGTSKVQLQAFMEAMVFNIKRLLVIAPDGFCIA